MYVDIFSTNQKYSIIYADPAWKYNFGATSSRFVNKKYTVMDKEDICNLPIEKICADNAVLLMWITFEYKKNVLNDKRLSIADAQFFMEIGL